MPSQSVYDVFLSHGSLDKPWVETLASELNGLGLTTFLDIREIETADSFPLVLDGGLTGSRFLVLILSPRSDRAWVQLEWASFLAHRGPLGRLIPVLLEPTEVPALLASIQRIDATDHDAARVGREIARIAGRPSDLKEGDARRLVLGQDLVFNLSAEGDGLQVADPAGRTRAVTPPWKVDNQFALALHFYDRLTREPVTADADRADLFRRAATLGSLLFGVLFDKEGVARLQGAMVPGHPRPLITIRSDDDSLLALPWELLHHDGSFLLRDARIDLARSTPGEIGPEALLREPDSHLKLVVNVSAPEGSGLDYEGESYRITRALSERCRFVPTELGTVEDLVETVRKEKPTAIHFSGHGSPGSLVFEDDEGREDVVAIDDLLQKLRERIDGALPPLFYLASCHGNDTSGAKAETSAACLHRAGVPQVVGYNGPIVDPLSTRAEEAFYRALAEAATTRYAVRQARVALAAPFGDPDARHRPRAVAEPGEASRAGLASDATAFANHTHPFAWAQLVLYHRGPDHSLSLPTAQGARTSEEVLRRTFTGAGDRKILSTGFIGRRSEMHKVRRRIRQGERVFVFQGLGGLGKSTLAFHVLPMLQRGEGEVLTLWCQEVEQRPDRAQGLVGQLLDFCRKKFGLNWEQVVQQVDREAGDGAVQRFTLFLRMLLQNVPRLVLYLDNLESLLIGPKEAPVEDDDSVFGEWASEELGQLWNVLRSLAQDGDRLYIVASCRYKNAILSRATLTVSPFPPDALFRLMSWLPALRRLSLTSRAWLVGRLAGHPRAVEYADDLLAYSIAEWEDRHGPWKGGEGAEREWAALVEPVLPKIQDRLRANLLLAEIWNRILDDHAQRMLYRMSLLRRPWEWPLVAALGEEGEDDEVAFATAERLCRTSLLEQVELLIRTVGGKFVPTRRFTLHPAASQFVVEQLKEADALSKTTHRRLGSFLEAQVQTSPFIEHGVEAGYHLIHGAEFDRAYELLGQISDWLQDRGQAREGLQLLVPFLVVGVQAAMNPERVGRLLITLGSAHQRLGAVEKAANYYEQALSIVREIKDRHLEGRVLGNLGAAFARLGETEKAIQYYERRLEIAHEVEDRIGEGTVLGNLGNAYTQLGELDKAVGYYEERLTIAREIGDHLGERSALVNMGSTHVKRGQAKKAEGCYMEALVIAREHGDRSLSGNILMNFGSLCIHRGEMGEGIRLTEEALVIAREVGDRRGEGMSLENLGIGYLKLGETAKAIALLEQSLAIGHSLKDRQIVQVVSEILGRLRS
jgi:tetratricopeptide (TPR) repeat protein